MKKILQIMLVLIAVFFVSACKTEDCEVGYHLEDDACVVDDTTAPVITAPSSLTLEIHADFDPLDGVSATDDVDGTVAVTVKSSDLDVDMAGSYTVVYEATDAAGNTSTANLTIGIAVYDANYLSGIDLGKLATDEKANVFAAAEYYLSENLYGGIPLWTAANNTIYSTRVQLYTTEYNTVMGYGDDFAQFTADDSTVKMDGDNYGVAGEYTWRSDFNVDPTTLNPWLAEDSVSSAFIGRFTGGLYNFYFDASKTGYEILGEHAAGEPVAVGGEEVNGRLYSDTWQVTLVDGLEWAFHPDMDTTGFDLALTAEDYLWTWETALNEGWFRAYSGGGDFISAGVKNADLFYQGNAQFDQVGLRLAAGTTNTLEFEFTTDKTAFDIKYMFAQSQTAVNEDVYEANTVTVEGVTTTTYGTDPLTVASSGIYIFNEYTPGQLLTFIKNDDFVKADLYHYTGLQYRYIADENSIFAEFNAGRLDSAIVPSEEAENYADDDRVYTAPDATTWRININGFGTETARDAYIAQYPELGLDETFVPEPILSYLEMRQALYYGVDRYEAAVNVVKTFVPASTYMTAMYFLDAESGLSIRGFDAGQAVEDDFAGTSYGYFPDAATASFKAAFTKALADGFYADYSTGTWTEANPYVIEILFSYHTPDNLARAAFVNYIAGLYEELLMDDERHVVIEFEIRPVAFPDHYNDYLQVAATDMGIGAIQGSLLDAPSFLDVFSDDNHGGFTMNYGIDTHTANIPITFTYDGELVTELWSYNAIAIALNGKTYIKDGVIQEYWDTEAAVIDAYLDMAGTTLVSSSDGAALMASILGMTEAEYATELDVPTVNATVVVGADGSNYLYVITEETGQFELVDSLALITDVATAITVHADYGADVLYAETAVKLVDDAAVAADLYAIDMGWATLADLWAAAGVPASMEMYAEAITVHWNGIYGEWDDIYVVYHIGDYYLGFAWL